MLPRMETNREKLCSLECREHSKAFGPRSEAGCAGRVGFAGPQSGASLRRLGGESAPRSLSGMGPGCVSRLRSLASEDIDVGGTREWMTRIGDELEVFLRQLRELTSPDLLKRLIVHARPEQIRSIHDLEMSCTALTAELCDVIYVLPRMQSSRELCESWLRSRIEHFLSAEAAIEKTLGDLRSVLFARPA